MKTDTARAPKAPNKREENLPQPRSIANKLNGRLFLRLLGIFISLDIFLCLLFAGGLFLYAEYTAANVAERILEAEYTGEEISSFYTGSYVDIHSADTQSGGGEGGIIYPGWFQEFFPELTASGVRWINLNRSADFMMSGVPRPSFRIWLSLDGQGYLIDMLPMIAIDVFWRLLAVLLIYELIVLLSKTVANARTVRKTLAPISELAAVAASSLNQSSFTLDELTNLAGTLDGINAARLGTRIDDSHVQDELRTLAHAINSMLDRINESYRAQTRFVADASHELRTPISVIQGYANLLDRWGKNDEKTLQESIDAIKDEANGMKDLVERLLFLARGDANNMIVKMERLNLSALAAETLRETRMIDKGHEYSSDINEAYVTGDEGLIKQALRILMDNAIKYTDSGGHIKVTVSREREQVRMTVQDEGIGMSPDSVPHIFDRFYRADDSRARATGGTGLGLSIAKWIVDRHGGHLEVLSRETIGTRVSIVLPAAADSVAEPTAPDTL